MIILIALRNLWRNKKNTLLLGLLISIITLIFLIGNTLIYQSNSGLRQTFVENLTGDLVLQKTSDISMNLFGANTPVIDDFFTVPTLPLYDEVIELLSKTDEVRIFSSQVSGQAVLDVLGDRRPVALCGIDASSYFKLFRGIKIKEGRYLEAEERGVMLSSTRVRGIEKRSGSDLNIGDAVMLTTAGDSGFKIQEIPLIGIYKYNNPGPYMDELVFIDPQTVRTLSSILQVASDDVEISTAAEQLLLDDFDDLFVNDSNESMKYEKEETSIFDTLMNTLGEEDTIDRDEWIGGDWNFILIRVDDSVSVNDVQSELDSVFSPMGISVVDWRTAAGNTAMIVLVIQGLFNAGMILIIIAGVLAIINILIISVFKRTKEIGSLRAIGSSDFQISFMILFENIFVSVVAGLISVVIGYILIQIINSIEYRISNVMISTLFGTRKLKIIFSQFISLQAVGLSVLIGLLSSIFPVYKALKIAPIEAMRKG